jgi:hypothetical protein
VQTTAESKFHTWKNPLFGCQSNDWDCYHARLQTIIHKQGFVPHVLGYTQKKPIYLLERGSTNVFSKNILIASGFHGEEPAGPWGLLHALDSMPSNVLDAVNISVLPLVNISGFSLGQRLNHRLENPNRGFLPLLDGVHASEEARVLLHHEIMLTDLGRDGVLSCHEDLASSSAYIYANESGHTPSNLALRLRDSNARFFPIRADGYVDSCRINNGIVFNHPDSSFEAWLLQRGATASYCTETPGLADFETRVLANTAMIKTFIEYHVF